MDIGARCQQCKGRGFIGNSPALIDVTGQPCDRCHGTGHNDGQQPTGTHPYPELAALGVSADLIAMNNAAIEFAAQNPPKYPPPFGALN